VHESRAGRGRGEGDVRAAVGGGFPVRRPVGGVDDRVGPNARGKRRDVVTAPDVELAPVRAIGWRGARVEGGDDAVARKPGPARDPQPETESWAISCPAPRLLARAPACFLIAGGRGRADKQDLIRSNRGMSAVVGASCGGPSCGAMVTVTIRMLSRRPERGFLAGGHSAASEVVASLATETRVTRTSMRNGASLPGGPSWPRTRS
jgi:hypothetical protein